MESRLRIAGEAIHPVLVMFPLGLFSIALFFDLGNLAGGPDILGQLAYWNIMAGLLGGVLVVLAGAIDLIFVRNGHLKRVGVLRNLISMGVLVFFAVIVMLRMQSQDRVIGWGVFAVEVVALAAAFYGAWFAGELANRRTAPALAVRRG
jgi:uncharacterized membrane protein